MKLGGKIHVSKDNVEIVKEFVRISDYVEIFYTDEQLESPCVLELGSSWAVHCPHDWDNNIALKVGLDRIERSIRFAGEIGARYAIVHFGMIKQSMDRDDMLDECARLISSLNDIAKQCSVRLLVENVFPKMDGGYTRLGCTAEEMKAVLEKVDCGFCLDFGHACAASATLGRDSNEMIEEFCELGPEAFHLYDGFEGNESDSHLCLGKGNLDIGFFVSKVKDGFATLELDPATPENFLESKKYLERFS